MRLCASFSHHPPGPPLDPSLSLHCSPCAHLPALAPHPPPRPAAEEKKPREERLVHSLDILEAFATLAVEVPTTRDRMPGLLAVVAAKKEHFLAK